MAYNLQTLVYNHKREINELNKRMNKKQLIVALVMGILLSGCATFNFSSKYYTLPTDYKKDIDEVWNNIILKVPLKYKNSYSYKITKDHETSPAGIPQIHQGVVSLPEYFIKYIWEFYYPNYHKAILTCTILHEMAHAESGILDKPPEEHSRCDIYAVNLMYNRAQGIYYLPYDLNDFYSSLIVIGQYWSARKGVGGNVSNVAWNIANVGTLVFFGYGYFRDWFAIDISTRLSLFKSSNPSAKFIFKRNKYFQTNKEITNPTPYISNPSSTQAVVYNGKIFSLISYPSEAVALKALDDFAAGRQSFNGQTFSLGSLPANSPLKLILESLVNKGLTVPLKSDTDGLWYIYMRVQ